MTTGFILRTIHGSHLYGTNHAGSDVDWYEIWLTGKNNQAVVNGVDTTKVNLETFVRLIDKGVPQAIEALFSPYSVYNVEWRPFLSALQPNVANARHTYRRTIKSQFLAGTPKKIKHAIRLSWNIMELETSGWYNPRLDQEHLDMLASITTDQARRIVAGVLDD